MGRTIRHFRSGNQSLLIETHLHTDYGKKMHQFIERMYPITRSITGNGVRKTLSLISEIIPLEISEVPSGTKVLDWEIPDEWNIRDAWVKDERGTKVVDFKKLNLHVLNYSEPVDKTVSKEELLEHVFTYPELPEAVPYRTSYHNRNWGFCMSEQAKEALAEGNYKVFVDADLQPGSLTYGERLIKGETDDEVLISTHICHPSLANDNLSGIAAGAFLAKALQSKSLKYSYRFLFIPVTIGSITWLSRNEENTERIKHGLVLTLLGDSSHFHYKKSRNGNVDIDRIMGLVLKESKKEFEIREFSPYGYDERQYCSPGFNLPVGRISRKPHGEFPEYHTSADNLDFVKPEKLAESLELLEKTVSVIEQNKRFLNLNPKGEPQLGKRGLFKKVGGAGKTKDFEMGLLWVLNLSDRSNDLVGIAEKSGLPFETIAKAADALQEVDLLKEVEHN